MILGVNLGGPGTRSLSLQMRLAVEAVDTRKATDFDTENPNQLLAPHSSVSLLHKLSFLPGANLLN